MGTKLRRIKARTKTVELNYGEDGEYPIVVTYRPDVLTSDLEEQMDEANGAQLLAELKALEAAEDDDAADTSSDSVQLASQKRAALRRSRTAQVFGLVRELIEAWDLEGDDDLPIPLTPEGLKAVGFAVLGFIVTGVMEDISKKKEKSRTSSFA